MIHVSITNNVHDRELVARRRRRAPHAVSRTLKLSGLELNGASSTPALLSSVIQCHDHDIVVLYHVTVYAYDDVLY